MAFIGWEVCQSCGKKLKWGYSESLNHEIGGKRVISCPSCHATLNVVGKHWVDHSKTEKVLSHLLILFIAIFWPLRIVIAVGFVTILIFGVDSIFSILIILSVYAFLFGIQIFGHIQSIRQSKKIKSHPDKFKIYSNREQVNSPSRERNNNKDAIYRGWDRIEFEKFLNDDIHKSNKEYTRKLFASRKRRR